MKRLSVCRTCLWLQGFNLSRRSWISSESSDKKNSKKAVHRIRERIPNFVLMNFHENETRKMFWTKKEQEKNKTLCNVVKKFVIRNSKFVVGSGEQLKTYESELICILKPCQIVSAKGQLISKCPFGVIVSTKIPTKKIWQFLP